MENDVGEWCSEGLIQDHRVICRLWSGSKADVYLAVNSKGENRHPTEHRLEAGGNRQVLASLVEREGVFSPPSHFVKNVPPELERIIMELMEKEPEKRPYRTADVLVNEFYKQWPDESRKMPHEGTGTLTSYE